MRIMLKLQGKGHAHRPEERKTGYFMTFNQLEYFCAVCRYHSITRAAEELFVSQPAISIAIRDLEKEFHVKLLNHQKNRISVTSEGELFYKKAEALLAQSHDMYAAFSDITSKLKPLRIAIPPIISTVFFPRIIDAFHEISDTPVELYEYGSVRARSMLDSETLDAAFVNMDFQNLEKYNYHAMLEDRIVYYVSRTHPLADRKAISMEDLEGQRIILLNTDSVLNRQIQSKLRAAGTKANIFMYCSQLYTTLNFVRGGDCGAFLYSTVPANPRDFVAIPLTPQATSRFGIIWKKETFISQRLKNFLDFVQHYDMSKYVPEL